MIYVKLRDENDEIYTIPLKEYCTRLGRRNNSVLFRLEKYLGIKLLSNDELKDIREIVLDISADITRLPDSVELYESDRSDLNE